MRKGSESNIGSESAVLIVQLLARTRQVEREQAEKAEAARLHDARFWIEKFMSTATQQVRQPMSCNKANHVHEPHGALELVPERP